MRLVWHSNAPFNQSGYGIETALFVPRIASLGHEILIAAPYSFSGTPLRWGDWDVFPCARDQAGNDTIITNHEYFGADLTITLADPFGLLKTSALLRQINIAHWFPVDCSPAGGGDMTVLREGMGIPVAMSRFGYDSLLDEGCDPFYVPLAVDTGIFSPGPREPYRESLPGVTDDTFIIGICAMNRDMNRKGFAEQILAFSEFHARHPDSRLVINSTQAANPGLNLASMVGQLGLTEVVSWPDGYLYDMGLVSQEQMAHWYRGLDVLSACSYGEGFGLPLIEAQACGIPVITTDASSMTELCGTGWLVSGTPFWTNGHAAWWQRPDMADIVIAYEYAWETRQDVRPPYKPARDFALQYDADRIFDEHWKPVLASLEEYCGKAA